MKDDQHHIIIMLIGWTISVFAIGAILGSLWLDRNNKTITIKFDTIKKAEQEVHHAR